MSMESGAAVIELSIALIVLFIFLIVFFQMTGIFLAHERLSYSAYAGARANVVNGSVGKSVIATKSQNYYVGGDTVVVYEYKRLPFNMSDIFSREGQTLRLAAEVTIPRELGTDGDN